MPTTTTSPPPTAAAPPLLLLLLLLLLTLLLPLLLLLLLLVDQMLSSAEKWPVHATEADNWVGWECTEGYYICCLIEHKDDTWVISDPTHCDTATNSEVTLEC